MRNVVRGIRLGRRKAELYPSGQVFETGFSRRCLTMTQDHVYTAPEHWNTQDGRIMTMNPWILSTTGSSGWVTVAPLPTKYQGVTVSFRLGT